MSLIYIVFLFFPGIIFKLQRSNKIGFGGNQLVQYPINKLPKYLQDNINNYKDWID